MKKYFVLLGFLLSFGLSLTRVKAEDAVIIGIDQIRSIYEAGTNPDSVDFTNGLTLHIIHDNVLADDKLLVDYSSVDFNRVGTYQVKYFVLYLTDNEDLRHDLATIDINIVDTTNPTLHGIEPIILPRHTDITTIDFLDGAYASDNDLGSDLTIEVLNEQTIDTSQVGSYPIVYLVTDNSLNTIEKKTYVHVTDLTTPDKTPPTITVNVEPIFVGLNSRENDYLQYVEAMDDDGTALTDFIKPNDSNINYEQLGTYQLLYTVSDKSGNTTEKKVEVQVVDDKEEPYFTNFKDEIHITVNEPYVLGGGLIAYDDVCGDVSDRIEYTITNIIDTSDFGTYDVTFKVTDLNGNEITMQAKVIVGDFLEPTITGPSSLKIKKSTDFNILDHLTITDNYDETVTTDVNLNDFDLNKPGSYLVQVTAKDGEGNESVKDIMITVYEIKNDLFYEHPIIVGSLVGITVSAVVTVIGVIKHKKKKRY